MNSEQFNWLVNKRCESIKEILTRKGAEYAANDERLHNFKISARRQNCSPERALMGMKDKHSVSIQDMVDMIENNAFNKNIEYIQEKLGDEINYLILLEALLTERIENNKIKPF